MTDTTDTAALREFLMEQIDHADSYGGKVWLCAEDARLAMSSLDRLEAERQRADANAQEIRKLEFQWEHRAPTQWAYDQACTTLHAQRERAEKAEAELAELKGEKVPVAYLYSASFERGEVEGQLTDAPGCDMPVYDRPQQPVVLPEKSINDYNRYWIDYQDTVAAIKAAGGIVKDGE